MLRSKIIAFLVLIVFVHAPVLSAPFTLYDRQSDPPVIVVGKHATPCERFAGQEMAEHLGQITGQQIAIIADDADVTGRKWIAIGENQLNHSIDISQLQVEQYVIDVGSDGVHIVGGRPRLPANVIGGRGTLYGVYEVLENLGARWYRPEPWAWYIPKLSKIDLPLGHEVSPLPAYDLRSGVAGGFTRYRPYTPKEDKQVKLWAVRNRLNSAETGSDPKYGGRVYYTFGHTYGQLFPPDEYFAEHPEYYGLLHGKRTPDAQLCLGNPEVQQLFAEKLIAVAKASPHLSSLSAEPDDGDPLCQCDLCRAMDDPKNPESTSNRVCAFSNIIARKVAAEVPGVRVHWLAYARHTAVPSIVTELEPNTIIQLCTINQWGAYSRKLLDPSSNWNKAFANELKGWAALKPSAIMTYEYWGGYGWPGPFPVTRTIADRVRNYRRFNVRGIYNETSPHWGPQGLELYMFAKLIWNPDLDLQSELNRYYVNYYGPAAKAMKVYHESWMDAMEQANPTVFSGGRGMHLVCKPSLIEKLNKVMAKAKKQIAGQTLYERRLAGVSAGLEMANRVCAILQVKHLESKPVAIGGRGTYLKSERAERMFDELQHYLWSFNEGEAVFDVPVEQPNVAPLSYLRGDILQNAAYGYLQEQNLLSDF